MLQEKSHHICKTLYWTPSTLDCGPATDLRMLSARCNIGTALCGMPGSLDGRMLRPAAWTQLKNTVAKGNISGPVLAGPSMMLPRCEKQALEECEANVAVLRGLHKPHLLSRTQIASPQICRANVALPLSGLWPRLFRREKSRCCASVPIATFQKQLR